MQRLYSRPLASVPLVNISIVGMNGSGKSAILVKYLTNRFIVEYAPYLSDSYTKIDLIDGQEVTLNIQDTSDSDDIDLDEVVRWSHAVIVVFSITSRRSFYRAQELVESLKQCTEQHSSYQHTNTSVNPRLVQLPSGISSPPCGSSLVKTSAMPPLMSGYISPLRRVANLGVVNAPKLVLVANKSDLDRFRLVERAEAEDYAVSHGMPFLETTASEYCREVQTMFHTVVRLTTTPTAPSLGIRNGKQRVATSSGLAGSPATATASVLSSLAATPGMLVQKKVPNSLVTSGDTATGGDSAESNTITSTASPVSLLANLRFRAASPPAFGKTLRSPSPGWIAGNQKTLSGSGTNISSRPISCSAVESHKLGSAAGLTQQAVSTLNVLSTSSPSYTSVRSSTLQHGAEEQPDDNAPQSCDTVIPSPDGGTASKSTIQQPPQLAPKKNTIGFRFFGKRAK